MGNKECKFSQKFNKKYQFIQFTNDELLGPIKIYRKKQPFYDYLMVVQKIVNDDELAKYEQQLQIIERSYQLEEDSMFLRLYGHEIIKDGLKNCNKKCKIRLYVQYLNYNLKSFIEYRNQQRIKFSIQELIYILKNIIKIYNFYSNIEAYDISFQSVQIFITPQGQLRFNPLNIFNEENYIDSQCAEINCKTVKFKKIFKAKDKLIIYQIKKILGQLTQLCHPSLPQERSLFAFKKQINSCTNLQQIQRLLDNPSIDKLQFNPRKIYRSEQETTKIFKNSPLISNSSKVSQNSKISVKNFIKQTKRPYSEQYRYH